MTTEFSTKRFLGLVSQHIPNRTQNRCSQHIIEGSIWFLAILVFLSLTFVSLIGCSPISRDHSDAQNTPPDSAVTSDQPASHSWHRMSQYLTMRDGVKIAVDLYLPDSLEPGQTIPTILHQTRYWRAFEYRWLIALFKDGRPRGLIGNYAERFLQRGYAWVDVDVRGSGASFGTRPMAYSPAEIQDGAEIVDWIITQPWSNGKVGAMGISYSGATAEMLLVNQHPAVKAIAPMFAGFDLYSEIAFPGGIHLSWFTETWSYINNRLDHNELPLAGWIAKLFVRGVHPVDGDSDNQLLAMAVQEHAVNWSPFKEASGLTFRDDPPPSRQAQNIDTLSTQHYSKEIEQSGAAIYSYSGWFDGGYALAAIKRHRQHHNSENKLILGPWDHGGKRQISPYALGPAQFDHAQELIRFFNQHLQDVQTGTHDELPVQLHRYRHQDPSSAPQRARSGRRRHARYRAHHDWPARLRGSRPAGHLPRARDGPHRRQPGDHGRQLRVAAPHPGIPRATARGLTSAAPGRLRNVRTCLLRRSRPM